MTHDAASLIADYIDGTITPERLTQLQALLRASADARRLLRDHATVAAKLEQVAARNPVVGDIAYEDSREVPFMAPTAERRRWLSRPFLVNAAAGLLIGLLTESMVFGYVLGWTAKVLVLLQESFESSPTLEVTGKPDVVGVWGGDFCTVTSSDQGVTPVDGTKMLKFLRADYEGKPQSEVSYYSGICRFFDLRPLAGEIANGAAVIQVSGQFNAARYPDDEEYVGSVILCALDAQHAELGRYVSEQDLLPDATAVTRNQFQRIDRDPATWQRLVAELRLPSNAVTLMVQFQMGHNTEHQRRVTFAGHYLDDVRVSLAQRPLVE